MFKKILLFLFVICFTVSTVYAQNQLMINEKEVAEGTTLNIFKDDLIGRKIIILMSAPEDIEGVEISLDKGRRWGPTTKTKDGFLYQYRPRRDEDLFIIFLVKDRQGSIKIYDPYVKIIYQSARPDEAILLLLGKMKAFYEQENKWQFMRLFSSRFPNRIEFEEAIQSDFVAYNNIRLRYRIDRKSFSGDFNSAIWDVFWERKYSTRTGTNVSDSSNIKMHFGKEGLKWLIIGMDGNDIFGSTVVADKPDFAIRSADISCAGVPAAVVAAVNNKGNADALNVDVAFKELIGGGGTTINVPRIRANSVVNVNSGLGCVGTYRVTVDPDKLIDELDETNNVATRNF
ncbi:MAG: hypothetical protein JSW17_01200 [Candidatus Omnitrophota bacterium]|nr:MAG: hypothetical protein JSW17_01200 [Candidatus Omnitrophota bacterium]